MSYTSSMIGLVSLALFSSASEAQDREDTNRYQETQSGASENSSVEPEPVPIVVLGDGKDERERDVLGSRIPKKPLFDHTTHSVATSTGTPGFTPGSGMDPSAGGIRRITTSTCKVSDSQISAEVACALIAAREAAGNEEWNLVRAYLFPLAENGNLSQVEHRAVADYLYISAHKSGLVPNKIEALSLLIESQTLSESETGNALRSLASLYLTTEQVELAVLTLEKAVRLDPEDRRALENLRALKENGVLSTTPQIRTEEP